MASLTATIFTHLETQARLIWRAAPVARLRGAFVMLLGLACLFAFASYDAGDPSLNTASSQSPHNILGGFGAVIADLGLQS